jgi:hypothetical protein
MQPKFSKRHAKKIKKLKGEIFIELSKEEKIIVAILAEKESAINKLTCEVA